MAVPAKKVKKRNPQKTLLTALVILAVGIIAIQLFYPATLDAETGKLSRIGGKKKTVNSSKPLAVEKSLDPIPETISDSDDPMTTSVIE